MPEETISIDESDRRLMFVVRKLKRIPPERFDFARWTGNDWKGKQDLSCGTTACGLGWAATIRELRKCGLRLRKFDEYTGYVTLADDKEEPDSYYCANDKSVTAAMKVFGLSKEEANHLFTPWTHIYLYTFRLDGLSESATASHLANHILKFIVARRRYHEYKQNQSTSTTVPTHT